MNAASGSSPGRKIGPWEALGIIAVLMALTLGFIFMVAAVIKWAI